jgi:hypothetical protein
MNIKNMNIKIEFKYLSCNIYAYIMNNSSDSEDVIDNINVDEILHSIESDKLLSVSKLTYDKINTIKYNVLTRIGLEDDELESMLLKLSDYRYVEELPDIHHGAFIRYIPLQNISRKSQHQDNDVTVTLKPGGFICDIKILGTGVQLLCRNHFRKMFQLRLDEVLLFQKLTKQEEVILSVFDYLNKK